MRAFRVYGTERNRVSTIILAETKSEAIKQAKLNWTAFVWENPEPIDRIRNINDAREIEIDEFGCETF